MATLNRMRCRFRFQSWLLLPALLLVPADRTRAQVPCTDQEALQRSGTFTLDRAEQDDLDRRLEVKSNPQELRNTDRAAELVKQSIAGFRGLDAKYWHDFLHGSPAGRYRKYSENIAFFDYYCVPMHGYGSEFAGKIRVGDETGTSIKITFNSLGEFVNEFLSLGKDMAAANGRAIFALPKEEGEWQGYRVFAPNLGGERSQAIILSLDHRFPFKPVSREQFLLARQKVAQRYLDEARSRVGATSPAAKERERQLTDLQKYRASMSPAELQSQAIVIEWSGDPNRGRVFAKDNHSGNRLVVVDPDFLDKTKPPDSIQLIVLFWRWEEGVLAKREMVERFKQNFDVVALERLLTQ